MGDFSDCYVYLYLDPTKSGDFHYGSYYFQFEPFYVGKGRGNRCYQHLTEAKGKTTHNAFKCRKIAKIWHSEKTPVIIKLYEGLSPKQATGLEKELIGLIGRRDHHVGPLTNLTDGGEGGQTTTHWDDSARQKMSARSKLWWSLLTKEQRQRRVDQHKKWWSNRTDEQLDVFRKRASAAWRLAPEEKKQSWRKKISAAKKGKVVQPKNLDHKIKAIKQYWTRANRQRRSNDSMGGNNPHSLYLYKISRNGVLIADTCDINAFCRENRLCLGHFKKCCRTSGKYKDLNIIRTDKETQHG